MEFSKKYAQRFKKSRTFRCNHGKEIDDAQHTIFECPKWEIYKELETRLTPDNLIQCMIREAKNWHIFMKSIEKIMETKEVDKRIRSNSKISSQY